MNIRFDDDVEQPKGGGGRSRNQYTTSKNARIKLNQLNFDPIERQVELYEEITRRIFEMEAEGKYSQMAYATLMSTKQKIANDLMRYGYSRMPETNEIKNINTAPVKIMLTDNKTFKEINPDPNEQDDQ